MAGGLLSTWSILPGVKKRREPPRPVEFRQPGYEDVFDYDTFFYDVFRDASSRRIIAIGPPLHNFLGTFEQINVSDGSRRLDKTIMLRDRNFQLWIDGARQVEEIVLWHEELTSPKLRITENRCALFEGKRVVFTLSKDNDLTWIADWARFYSVCHGADGVLLYDNGSQRYTIEEIREAILALSPSMTIEIVPWPFKFGARGGTHQRWDSDYCQYGALEHARHKYLRSAASVMSCDIDELVVSTSGKSIFEVTETKRRGYTVVTGVIMPNNFDPSAAGPRRFLNYHYSEPASKCPNKWCVVPAKCGITQQWKVHGVTGFSNEPNQGEFVYRHFRGINTNWTFDRSRPEPISSKHHRDEAWLRSMERAFGVFAPHKVAAVGPGAKRPGTRPMLPS